MSELPSDVEEMIDFDEKSLGLFGLLSDAQKQKAREYDGPENFGPPTLMSPFPLLPKFKKDPFWDVHWLCFQVNRVPFVIGLEASLDRWFIGLTAWLGFIRLWVGLPMWGWL